MTKVGPEVGSKSQVGPQSQVGLQSQVELQSEPIITKVSLVLLLQMHALAHILEFYNVFFN